MKPGNRSGYLLHELRHAVVRPLRQIDRIARARVRVNRRRGDREDLLILRDARP